MKTTDKVNALIKSGMTINMLCEQLAMSRYLLKQKMKDNSFRPIHEKRINELYNIIEL
jgi:hypothetical protein